jgi:hypothetical protein
MRVLPRWRSEPWIWCSHQTPPCALAVAIGSGPADCVTALTLKSPAHVTDDLVRRAIQCWIRPSNTEIVRKVWPACICVSRVRLSPPASASATKANRARIAGEQAANGRPHQRMPPRAWQSYSQWSSLGVGVGGNRRDILLDSDADARHVFVQMLLQAHR